MRSRNRKRTHIRKARLESFHPISESERVHAHQCFFGRDLNTPPQKGKIRFFGHAATTGGCDIPSWISNMVYGPEHSILEWCKIIQNYRQHALCFPFIREHVDTFYALIAKEFRLRCVIQKFIRNVRIRLFARRVIGLTDLYTMSLVPAESQVRVCDYASKSVYVFHTQTIIRVIESALKHSMYGIPIPHMARNPYTNISFTVPQLISILSQIGMNCARAHRFPPLRLVSFRNAKYDLQRYKSMNRHKLNMDAAISFLHAFHDPIGIEFYMEVLNDTVEAESLNTARWNLIRVHIRDRSMRPDILKRFDILVLSLFLFQNHSISYSFASYTAMLDEFESAYKAALVWWKNLPRRILPPLPRVDSVAFSGTPQNIMST